jgi:hypothetical protein
MRQVARSILLCAGLLCCKGRALTPEEKDPAVAAALALIAEARGGGIAPARLELGLMDTLRQLEAARAAEQQKAPPEKVAAAYAGAAPSPAISADERARRYAGNATAKLGRLLQGPCQALAEDVGGELRVGSLAAPLRTSPAPPGAEEALSRLRQALAGARLIAVTCERGSVGILLVQRDAGYRVVDMVPTGRGAKGPPIPTPAAKPQP